MSTYVTAKTSLSAVKPLEIIMWIPVFLLGFVVFLHLTESKEFFLCDGHLETFVKSGYALPVTQTTANRQYIGYLLVRGMMYISVSTAGKCAKVCGQLPYCLAKTAPLLSRVIHLCQRPACDSVSWGTFSLMPPCGAVAFSSNVTGKFKWNLELPSALVFNITVWEVKSRVMPASTRRFWVSPLKLGCSYVSHLVLERKDLDRLPGEPSVRLYICGNTPTQHIILGPEIQISWKNVIPYEEKSSFCFSYQPIAKNLYFTPSSPFPRGHCNLPYPYRSRDVVCEDIIPLPWENIHMKDYYKDDLVDGESNIYHTEAALDLFNVDYMHVLKTANAVRYYWLVTGTVVNIPVVTITTFTCKRQETAATIDDVQLRVLSCPSTIHTDVSSIERYFLGEVLLCSSNGYVRNKTEQQQYESKSGDLTVQLSQLFSDYITFIGNISYRRLICPGRYCEQSVYNISTKTRISTSSLEPNLQQRVLLFPASNSSEFLMLSDLTVEFAAPTYPLCGWGGIYIYELNPLSLIAKICSPWVASAWNASLRREDGTRRLHFNNRPVLLIVKSYLPTSLIHIEAFVSLSQCAGMVNPAFQKLIYTSRVIQGRGMFGIVDAGSFQGYQIIQDYFVSHTDGCFQVQHLQMDGNYAYDDSYPLAYVSQAGGKIRTNTIGAIRNKGVLSDTAYKALISFLMMNAPWKMMPCKLEGMDINVPTIHLLEDIWTSFAVYGTRYSLDFQPLCLIIGLGLVTVMEKEDIPSEPVCLTTEEVEKQRELGITKRNRYTSTVTIHIPLRPTTCGEFGLTADMFPKKMYLFLFNKPGSGELCCSLNVDLQIQMQDLALFKGLELTEYYMSDGDIPKGEIFIWGCDYAKVCTHP